MSAEMDDGMLLSKAAVMSTSLQESDLSDSVDFLEWLFQNGTNFKFPHRLIHSSS